MTVAACVDVVNGDVIYGESFALDVLFDDAVRDECASLRFGSAVAPDGELFVSSTGDDCPECFRVTRLMCLVFGECVAYTWHVRHLRCAWPDPGAFAASPGSLLVRPQYHVMGVKKCWCPVVVLGFGPVAAAFDDGQVVVGEFDADGVEAF